MPAKPATSASEKPEPVRVNQDFLRDWPLKPEAAARLGVSLRALERLIAARQVGVAWRKSPTGKPMRVCNPDDLAEIKAGRDTNEARQMVSGPEVYTRFDIEAPQTALAPSPQQQAAVQSLVQIVEGVGRSGESLAAAAEAVGRAADQLQTITRAVKKQRVPLTEKLLLRLFECDALGVDRRRVKKWIHEGLLENFGVGKQPRVSRIELGKLLGRGL